MSLTGPHPTMGPSGEKGSQRFTETLAWAKARLVERPDEPWTAADVRKLVVASEAVTRQRLLLYLGWARDMLILLIMEGQSFKGQRWQTCCEVAREVLVPVEDLLHVAGKDEMDPKLLQRVKEAGLVEDDE